MITKGTTFGDAAARVLVELGDPSGRRWSSPQIIEWFNQGTKDAARAYVFTRTDIHVPMDGQGRFELFTEAERITSVDWDFKGLRAESAVRLDTIYGHLWRSVTGTPTCFVFDGKAVTLYPKPGAGSALTVNTPSVSESDGAKITGDQMNAVNDAGTIVHFNYGDGVVPDAEATGGNVRITYNYIPTNAASQDVMPTRYENALKAYAIWKAYQGIDVPEEQARAAVAYSEWQRQLALLVGAVNKGARTSNQMRW